MHGTAYEFLRNTELDANNFFNNARGIARPIYKQHDFGFSAGGPVMIPKLYNGKNKTFFFVSYEAFRNREGATGAQRTVPTPEMYGGDFRNWVDSDGRQIPIYNPISQTTDAAGQVTRQVFANNQIPASLFDPEIVKALGVFRGGTVPVPNNGAAPGTVGYVQNNYLVTGGSVVKLTLTRSSASRATTSLAESTASRATGATTAPLRSRARTVPPTCLWSPQITFFSSPRFSCAFRVTSSNSIAWRLTGWASVSCVRSPLTCQTAAIVQISSDVQQRAT